MVEVKKKADVIADGNIRVFDIWGGADKAPVARRSLESYGIKKITPSASVKVITEFQDGDEFDASGIKIVKPDILRRIHSFFGVGYRSA